MAANQTSPEPVETETKGDRTRGAILTAAYALFVANGYHGTSMRNIARQAGIALGGIYNHFDNKEAIFAAVLNAYHPYHRILPALEAAEGDSVEAFVRDAARRMRAVIAEAHKTVPLVFIELVEFQGRHFTAIAERTYPALIAFAQSFDHRQGRLRPVPKPIILRSFIGLILTYTLSEVLLNNTPMAKNVDFDWFEGMLDLYLHGILAEPGGPGEA